MKAQMDLEVEKPEGLSIARGGDITLSIAIESLPHYYCIIPAQLKEQIKLRAMLDYLIAEAEKKKGGGR